MTLFIFWLAVFFVVFTYAGFPLLLVLRSLLVRRPHRPADIEPTISLIVVAHNEADSIGAKLENILSLDYPREKLEIIIASDGSNDDTEPIVERYAGDGVRLLSFPRRGKIPALNDAVATAHGEVLVFSDANSMYDPRALRALVRHLSDPAVGGVAGDQRYVAESSGANAGERAYWSFDRWLKQLQSQSGSTTSATGAIYAIRRSLFRNAPTSVTDDFAVSTAIVAQGYRLIFADDAVAYEPVAKASGVEFGRKVRVITRGLRGVLVRRQLLNPLRYGFYSLQLFMHKVARRLVALPLIIVFACSLLLWDEGWIYQAATILQLAFYGSAATHGLLERWGWGRFKVLAVPHYVCLVNLAALIAAWNVLRGHRIERWEPQRSPAGEPSIAIATAGSRGDGR